MTDQATGVNHVIDGEVGIIEISRPVVFNALSSAVLSGLRDSLKLVEQNSDVKAVLIRTTGKNFCTGADLNEVNDGLKSRDVLERFLRNGHDALRTLERSALPVVIAVQGLALAGGLELMLAGDIVFAGRSARFGDQHGQFGLIPGWGGSQRLPRIIGSRRALDLFLGVRWVDAETALAWGLVNYVVEDDQLIDAALSYCRKICERSPTGLSEMKRLGRLYGDRILDDDLEAEIQAALRYLPGPDVVAGIEAFRAKSRPKFAARKVS
ncbi:MAG TPA: enoyl-CoA hydratase/isomerase family protein [Xanthobacteraceae bacterium]|nr:enoyl-CoA hydratase/isomerase family protein [Xanthobacteraceae bacterium]